jgi:hypothetical protein
VNQKWHETEPNPDQIRHDSEPAEQKQPKQAQIPQNVPPKIEIIQPNNNTFQRLSFPPIFANLRNAP